VGKTTTALSLSAALAELGHHVLLVDFDPQANATTGLGLNAAELSATVYTVLLSGDPVMAAIRSTAEHNLSLLPSSIDLAGAELELAGMDQREHVLERTLGTLDGSWDYVIIDSPPSLGLLTLNVLTAAREVIVPIQSEYYALEGLTHLLRTISMVKADSTRTWRCSGFWSPCSTSGRFCPRRSRMNWSNTSGTPYSQRSSRAACA